MKRALSFAAGGLLAVCALVFSVLQPALQPQRFERAVLDTVNPQAVGMSESDLTAFARDTMAYVRGESEAWNPRLPFAVPESFRAHMAEVRGAVKALRAGLPLGLLLAALGLLAGRCRRAARLGALAITALIAAALVWAAVDFERLWMLIHRLFIPGGIFPAGEPIMQLFPLQLFFSYAPPVAVRLSVCLAALWLGLCINPKRRKAS